MLRSRLFWRVFGTYGALVLSAIGLLGVAIMNRVETNYEDLLRESLATRIALIDEVVHSHPAEPAERLQQQVQALGAKIGTRITLLAADGTVLADSEKDPAQMENHAGRPEVLAAKQSGQGGSSRFSQTLQQLMMYQALHTPGRGRIAYVRVALPLVRVQGQLADLRVMIWTTAGLTSCAALVLAFWLARRNTWPLQELTAGTEMIAQGAYGHRVYAGDSDEIGTLARTFNHMSERLSAQFAQIEEDRQQLRAVLGGMVEGVIALDAEQRIVFANTRASKLLGQAGDLPAGRKLWEVVRHRGLQEVVQRALVEVEPYHQELTWKGPGVKSLMVHAARLAQSPSRGAVLVLHDTTELRRLERLRHEFVGNVSHELKTPLSVINACVETLVAGAADDPEARSRFLEQIKDQSNRLHALILDLLSLARIESGTEVFEFREVALDPLVAACVERHRARAESNQQVLEAVGSGLGDAAAAGGPQCRLTNVLAWADEEAVDQVLENLVDNALKYTPAGGRIRVRWYAEDGHVCLEVSDTGIGIPPQDLPRIFERFYRVDKARSRELGGTGLGLSIVKHLVQALHGTVQATSSVGQGTTFTVRLPQALVA